MGAEDFMLDGYNMFMNPRLMGSQQAFVGGFNYEDMISIYGNAPTYGASGGLFSASGISGLPQNIFGVQYQAPYQQNYNMMYNGGMAYSYGQNLYGNSYVGQQAQQPQSYNMMFDGGVAYRNNSFYYGPSMLNNSSTNAGSEEELYIGGAYIPKDIQKESKGYSYSISTNGTVRYIGPGRKIMTLDEFKTALGNDFDKFKEVINKDCKERGFNEAIS